MAQWNNDITFSQWLNICATFSLFIIYSVFIIRIAISLHSKNKAINAFLWVTLVLIGLSIVFLQLLIIV